MEIVLRLQMLPVVEGSVGHEVASTCQSGVSCLSNNSCISYYSQDSNTDTQFAPFG